MCGQPVGARSHRHALPLTDGNWAWVGGRLWWAAAVVGGRLWAGNCAWGSRTDHPEDDDACGERQDAHYRRRVGLGGSACTVGVRAADPIGIGTTTDQHHKPDEDEAKAADRRAVACWSRGEKEGSDDCAERQPERAARQRQQAATAGQAA